MDTVMAHHSHFDLGAITHEPTNLYHPHSHSEPCRSNVPAVELSDEQIQRLIDYIGSNHGVSPSLDEIAQELRDSRVYGCGHSYEPGSVSTFDPDYADHWCNNCLDEAARPVSGNVCTYRSHDPSPHPSSPPGK